jgi:putative endonuclease
LKVNLADLGKKCMHYVYVLLSKKDRQLYIGYTTDLKRRILKHQKGFVHTTKHRLPIILIYYEAYAFQSDAKRREKFLKGGKGRQELKIQLQDVLRKLRYKNI